MTALRAVSPPAAAPAFITALDAERAFLGACLAGSPDAAAELDRVEAADLAEPRHARVLEALVSLRARGARLDPVLVLAELRNLGHVETWGDAPGIGLFLHDLLRHPCSGPSAPFYAELLREAAARRRLQVASERLAQVAERSSLDGLQDLAGGELVAVIQALARVRAT